MLYHTHILPVNPVGQNAIDIDQLWSGLMLRVLEQTRFTVGLDSVDILESTDNHYQRALHFGSHIVRDCVHCVPHESVEFITDKTNNAPSGRLLIRLLQESGLSLSFEYMTHFPEPSNDEERQLLNLVKSAYIATDTDLIRIIREIALSTDH